MLVIKKIKITGATEYFQLGIIEKEEENITTVSIIGGEPKKCSVQQSKIKKDWNDQEYFIRNGSKYYVDEFLNC